MPWLYEITTGKLFDPCGDKVASGYSGGNCGKVPEAVNDPAYCSVHATGPIPVGLYTHGLVVDHSQLGPFAIPLLPFQSNDMFGRGGLFMHGDNEQMNESASEGCIIMPFTVRKLFYNSTDNVLEVVAIKV